MQCWHITLSAHGRATLFPTEALLRCAVRTLARVLGRHLVVFCIVDDHMHLVLLCAADQVRVLARDLLFALRALTSVPISPPHVQPLDTRAHRVHVVRRYVLDQPRKHGLAGPPALWSGSCFLDLAGARVVPGLRLRLPEVLPRFRLRDAFEVLGLPVAPLVPATPTQVRAAGATRLVSAAAAAAAADPALPGRPAEVLAARRAAARLAAEAGLASADLAAALGVRRGSVSRLAAADAPNTLYATRLRLSLEDRAQRGGGTAFPDRSSLAPDAAGAYSRRH